MLRSEKLGKLKVKILIVRYGNQTRFRRQGQERNER